MQGREQYEKRGENLGVITLLGSIVPSTPSRYCLRGLQTFLPLLSFLPHAYRSYGGFTCHLQPLRKPSSTMYLITNCFLFELLHSAYNNTSQPARNNLLVYSLSNSHHQRLVATLLWQPIVWCSKSYPWLAPLLFVL